MRALRGGPGGYRKRLEAEKCAVYYAKGVRRAGGGFRQGSLDLTRVSAETHKGHGAEGHHLESTDQLAGILKNCLDAPGVHLVEVPVDYSENERVLIEELNAITCII